MAFVHHRLVASQVAQTQLAIIYDKLVEGEPSQTRASQNFSNIVYFEWRLCLHPRPHHLSQNSQCTPPPH